MYNPISSSLAVSPLTPLSASESHEGASQTHYGESWLSPFRPSSCALLGPSHSQDLAPEPHLVLILLS